MDHPNEHTPLISGPSRESQPGADSNTYLARFRQAVGINAKTSSPIDLESARRSAKGIYKYVISAQKWKERQYLLIDAIFYVALLTNIIIGAILASLGSLSTLHPTAIPILGVVNSSTAGILALLKGQGLPDRLRKDEYEMRKVQDFIEQTETALALGTMGDIGEKELDDLIKDVFERYNVARDTVEMNRPASYVRQVDVKPGDAGPDAEASGGEGHEPPHTDGGRQTKLALSSGKGKALVMS